jgi:hypothetical protein
MRKCVIDQQTNQCVNIIILDDDVPFNSSNNQILASRHDGEIGWHLIDGEWVKEQLPEPDAAFAAIQRRNKFLRITDKFVLPDFPLSDDLKVAIVNYRQQLRDLTDQSGFPNSIVWPEQPFDILK